MFVIAEEVNYDKLQKYLSYGIRFPYPTMEEAITSNTERITAKIDAELRKQSTRHIRSKLNNVTGTIGDDVTLIDCDIKDSEVNVPSGSVLIDVTIHNSTFNVIADVCKINGSNITDSCCALYANTCLINCLNMTSTCLNMTGSVMFVSGVKLRHNKAYNESSILNVRAADKEILMHNKDICVVGMNTIDNPKIFIDAGSRGYYYTHAQTYCKWHLGKYSITTTDGVIKARVINNGTLLIASRLSGLGLIPVGKDLFLLFNPRKLKALLGVI